MRWLPGAHLPHGIWQQCTDAFTGRDNSSAGRRASSSPRSFAACHGRKPIARCPPWRAQVARSTCRCPSSGKERSHPTSPCPPRFQRNRGSASVEFIMVSVGRRSEAPRSLGMGKGTHHGAFTDGGTALNDKAAARTSPRLLAKLPARLARPRVVSVTRWLRPSRRTQPL